MAVVCVEDYDKYGDLNVPASKRRKLEIEISKWSNKIQNMRFKKKKSFRKLPYKNNKSKTMQGKGLEKFFIPYNENIVYEYYDDPNELCDRLKLLVSSKAAGNTNHDQEINSIIEELRENNIID